MYIYSYRKNIVPSVPIQQLNTTADIVINDVELTESAGNQVLWTLNAKMAEIFNDQKETRLTGVNARFFDEEGKALNLVGDEGLKSDTAKTITLTGNVVAVNEEGVKLRAHQLVYDTTTGIISSEKPVTLERGNTTTTGEGFKARADIKSFKFERNVKTLILPKDGHRSNHSVKDSMTHDHYIAVTQGSPLYKTD
jgi:LPS export ABC transporter protein LptC